MIQLHMQPNNYEFSLNRIINDILTCIWQKLIRAVWYYGRIGLCSSNKEPLSQPTWEDFQSFIILD